MHVQGWAMEVAVANGKSTVLKHLMVGLILFLIETGALSEEPQS